MKTDSNKILDAIKQHEEDASKTNEESLEYKIHQSIGKIFEEHNIEQAAVVFSLPENNSPALYYRGHYYDAAKLLALALRQLKNKIADELA